MRRRLAQERSGPPTDSLSRRRPLARRLRSIGRERQAGKRHHHRERAEFDKPGRHGLSLGQPLPRPNPLDPPVQVEVALIRDWRKLLVVEQADEAVAVQNWQADLAPQHQRFWEEGWQALPAPPAPTTPKLIPVITTGHGMDAVELAQTYFQR